MKWSMGQWTRILYNINRLKTTFSWKRHLLCYLWLSSIAIQLKTIPAFLCMLIATRWHKRQQRVCDPDPAHVSSVQSKRFMQLFNSYLFIQNSKHNVNAATVITKTYQKRKSPPKTWSHTMLLEHLYLWLWCAFFCDTVSVSACNVTKCMSI